MADITDRNRNLDEKYRDQGDGTYARQMAALGYAWDLNTTAWVKVTADHNTGGLNVVFAVPTLKTASFSQSSAGTVVAAVGGKRIKVYSVLLGVNSASSVNWRDGASTAIDGAMAIAANGGYALAASYPTYLFATTAGNALDLVVTGGGTASGRVSYWDTDTT